MQTISVELYGWNRRRGGAALKVKKGFTSSWVKEKSKANKVKCLPWTFFRQTRSYAQIISQNQTCDFLSHVSHAVRKRLFLVTAAPSVMRAVLVFFFEFQKLQTISYPSKHYSSVGKISINNSAPLGRYKGTDHRTRNWWQLLVMLVACT